MPLNTIHHYLKGLMDGTVVPGTAGTIEAFIAPPDPETEPTPKVYIWGATGKEERQAGPRVPESGDLAQAGWKEFNHTVDLWLVWFSDEETDAPVMDYAFPAVVDILLKVLRESPDPVMVKDPLTGMDSELLDIGEEIDVEMYPPRAVSDQRTLRYDAKMQLKIMEVFQS
jgi:hypothetical protein